MKVRLAVVFLAGLALACAGCMVDAPARQAEAEQEEEEIDGKVATVIELVGQSRITGDRTALDEYLAAEDPDGELRGIVDAALSERAVPRSLGEWGFTPETFKASILPNLADGDVLLFAGDDVITADLLDLVFVNAYSHAGIVAAPVEGVPEVMSVLSATVTDWDGSGFLLGVRFQSLEELYLTCDTWTRVRHTAPLAGGWAGDFAEIYNPDSTVYSFVNLSLDAIDRWDPKYWYCSKVPWRVYHDYGAGADIEEAGFYTSERLAAQMEGSLVYQLYACFYYKLPRWLRRYVTPPAVKLATVLGELITPDELRYYGYDEVPLPVDVIVWGDDAPEHVWF